MSRGVFILRAMALCLVTAVSGMVILPERAGGAQDAQPPPLRRS